VPADAVTVTHDHGDHTFTAGVRGNFTLVDGRQIATRTQITAANLPFTLILGFHDGQNGSAIGPNTMIQWTQSGLRFAHLGDLGQDALTDGQLADLQNLDVLFIPAGGLFTIDATQAAVYANQLGARVTILVHYRTGIGGPPALDALPAVASPFGTVVYKPSSVVISRATLPASREVWVMEPAAPAFLVNAGVAPAGAVALHRFVQQPLQRTRAWETARRCDGHPARGGTYCTRPLRPLFPASYRSAQPS
jgi:hypothetical protein